MTVITFVFSLIAYLAFGGDNKVYHNNKFI